MEQELQVQVCSPFFDSCPETEKVCRWISNLVLKNLRSDIDVVAIRAGCSFVGFAGSNFNGAQMTVHRKVYDRFPVFAHFFHFQF